MRTRDAFVFPFALRDTVSTIRIPLRPTVQDVTLNLQQVIGLACDRYRATIDYTADPDPPLGPVEGRWADELLREAGVRE